MITSNLQHAIEIAQEDMQGSFLASSNALMEFTQKYSDNPDHEFSIIDLQRAWRRADSEKKREVEHNLDQLAEEIFFSLNTQDNTTFKALEEKSDYLEKMSGRDLFRGHAMVAKNIEFQYKTSGFMKSKTDGFRLSEINFTLRLGEITGVVGKNAYGKTTLFKILSGELKLSSGELSFPELDSKNAKSTDWNTVKSQMEYVKQELSPWYGSLEDNIRYKAALSGILGKENDRAFDYIVERLGLREYLDLSWKELSGGFKLRFELARALITKPRLLILDEPLANLDFQAQTLVLNDIRALASSFSHPMAVILSTQHIHEVEAIADRILFLSAGEQDFEGRLTDIAKDRSYNAYEIKAQNSWEFIEAALRENPQITGLRNNGTHQTIFTHKDLNGADFRGLLNKRKINFEYFRDISRSVKFLFETSEH